MLASTERWTDGRPAGLVTGPSETGERRQALQSRGDTVLLREQPRPGDRHEPSDGHQTMMLTEETGVVAAMVSVTVRVSGPIAVATVRTR